MALTEEKFYKAIGEVKKSISDEALRNSERHGDIKVALTAIEKNEEDIERLKNKSDRNDGILAGITAVGTAIGIALGLRQ